MYTSVQLAKKWFHYYRHASNSKGHGMHSPFVFDFIKHVLNSNTEIKPPATIEVLRTKLLHDRTAITINDFGAGSRIALKQKTVRRVAKTAVKPKKWGFFFYRLVQHYGPKTIVELGTSLGISTAYFAAAAPTATLISIEGSPAIQKQAVANFQTLNMGFIKSLCGPFDDVLPGVLASVRTVDLAYIDGNHRLEPTLQYFEQLLQKKNDASIFIFDDIHWSAEMEEAWRHIKAHPSVRYTIDLFFLGLVFFKPEFKIKQHFTIRF